MSAEGIIYRDATSADAAALADFSATTFVDTFGHLYPPDDLAAYLADTYGAAIQGAELADIETRYRLALRGGAIVGYSKAGRVKMDTPFTDRSRELHRLYVAPDAKGAGIAQRLMDDVLGWARADGADALYLSVWEKNERAQRFYRRYGFEHIGEHGFMVGAVRDRDFIWRLQL